MLRRFWGHPYDRIASDLCVRVHPPSGVVISVGGRTMSDLLCQLPLLKRSSWALTEACLKFRCGGNKKCDGKWDGKCDGKCDGKNATEFAESL